MNKWILAICLISSLQTAWSSDYSAYIKDISKLGSGVSNNIKQPENYTPRYTNNPPLAEQYYGGGVSLPTQYGESKIAGCKNNVADSNLYLRQECEGVNFIANNKTQKPDVTVSANEKLVQGTQRIAGDPAETLDKYKWKYPVNADGSIGTVPTTACPTETIELPAVVVKKSCSQYTGAELFLCEAALNVKVDPNWNYSCLETKYQNQRYECGKKLTVVCENTPDCTAAGVQAGSFQGDMHLHFWKNPHNNRHLLRFGSIGDNYWGDGQYDREFTVHLKNIKNLSVFSLDRVEYDDWLVVKVNDTIVYSSHGNKMLEYKEKYFEEEDYDGSVYLTGIAGVFTDSDTFIGGRERGISWKRDLNIDLRPFLREGKNTIWTRTIVGHLGENALMFSVHQYCEPVCHEKWENGCAEYEKRVTR